MNARERIAGIRGNFMKNPQEGSSAPALGLAIPQTAEGSADSKPVGYLPCPAFLTRDKIRVSAARCGRHDLAPFSLFQLFETVGTAISRASEGRWVCPAN
jgi:hypothetical protein